ncbi:prenyltransferase [Paenibacillus sp. FSL R5-0887]|uniref:prenyltransferase n=1 Tax=Paenibacillus sp. FSL R5-0887 TaxID=2921662 RepID=UPI0030F5EDC7
MNKWTLFTKATRFWSFSVMLIPIVLGTVGAYVWEGTFHPVLFILTLIGAISAHLFSNMVNDLWDFRNGTDTEAKNSAGEISTNSGLLTGGILSESFYARMTWSMLAIALICGGMLSIYSGWNILWFVLVGALIAYFYVAPPLRYGYRGKGYSEMAIFIAFGIMPVLGSYFVQTGQFSMKPVILSLPVGFLTTLLLFNHHFLHWKADEQAGKLTLVVVWGEQKALVFSRVLLFTGYASVIVCVLLGVLPVYALLALVTAFWPLRIYSSLKQHNASPAYIPLMGASQKASVRCGVVMAITLLIQGLI